MIVVVQPKKTVYHLKFAEEARQHAITFLVEITELVEVRAKDVEVENVLKFAG